MFMMEKCLETPEIAVISRHLAVQNSIFGGCAPRLPEGLTATPDPQLLNARPHFARGTRPLRGIDLPPLIFFRTSYTVPFLS